MQRKRRFFVVKSSFTLVLAVALTFSLSYMPIDSNDLTKTAIAAASISFMIPLNVSAEQSGELTDTLPVNDSADDTNDTNNTNESTDDYSDFQIPYMSTAMSAAMAADMATDMAADIPQENTADTPKSSALSDDSTTVGGNISPIADVQKPANSGSVIRKLYLPGSTLDFINLNNGFLKNCTAKSGDFIADIAKQKPKFKIKADKSPQVLIMHTHATESYQTSQENNDWFIKGESSRTTDLSRNTIAVGNEIEAALIVANIGVIHDKTLHDYPSYNGSYERSAATVKRILKEHPSIKVVLDVHRDAISPSGDTIIAPTVEINGKSCAQVMIIAGCEKEDGSMGLPNYKENLKFACAFQREIAGQYENLCRPILFDYRKYNQNLTTGSLLLEMGGHANTLDEALYCGKLVGKCLADTLLKLN